MIELIVQSGFLLEKTMTDQYSIQLRREMTRKRKRTYLDSLIQGFIRMAFSADRGKGWTYTLSPSLTRVGKEWIYQAKIIFQKTSGRKALSSQQWSAIFNRFKEATKAKRFSLVPWIVMDYTQVPGMVQDVDTTVIPVQINPNKIKNYGSMSLDMGSHFDHIFGRDPHILRVYSALETCMMTQLQQRQHCVLWGPPGCGKTELLLAIGRMLGEEDKAYMKFDATSMTQAGVHKLLYQTPVVPPVLIVEEIEKTSDKDLRWLLGLLDKRGEIRQTNFNVGNRMANVKVLCLATVNDMELFKRVMSGALYSRFANRIYCPRPTREEMQMILTREIKGMKGGNMSWIEPSLKFCWDEMKWNDPREIIPVCVCGRDRLLDGSYQEAIKATLPPTNEQD